MLNYLLIYLNFKIILFIKKKCFLHRVKKVVSKKI